ncbi:MAG: hypothetical protein EBU97_02245, partial [Rhodobacteraceae bacterium]|nr:hypothetical protein [Paracoccaceae bacterium]
MGAGEAPFGGTTPHYVTDAGGGIVTGRADDIWAVTPGAGQGMASVNPTTGAWSHDLNDADPALWKLGAHRRLRDVFALRMTDADGRACGPQAASPITGMASFLRGTCLDTTEGPVAVEDLHPGQMILTADHGPRPLAWVGHSRLEDADLRQMPKANPVRIRAGAFGPGLPLRDLLVSPQHRLCLRPAKGGGDAILVPAV